MLTMAEGRRNLRDLAKLQPMKKSRRAGLLDRLMILGVAAVLIGAPSASFATSPQPAKIDLDAFDALKETVALPDGEVLSYIDLGNRAGIAVVLIHGYTDSARDWVPMLPYVSKLDWAVKTVTLMGTWASDSSRLRAVTTTVSSVVLSAAFSPVASAAPAFEPQRAMPHVAHSINNRAIELCIALTPRPPFPSYLLPSG